MAIKFIEECSKTKYSRCGGLDEARTLAFGVHTNRTLGPTRCAQPATWEAGAGKQELVLVLVALEIRQAKRTGNDAQSASRVSNLGGSFQVLETILQLSAGDSDRVSGDTTTSWYCRLEYIKLTSRNGELASGKWQVAAY